MQSFTSLWSADPLHMGNAIDVVAEHTDGFHIDVMDGHLTPQLLFGPDFVAAVKSRTSKTVDVHLMVDNADAWIPRFAEAGADMISVHSRSTPDLAATLQHIDNVGSSASLVIEVDEQLPSGEHSAWSQVSRILVMGTQIGIKGVEPNDETFERTAKLRTTADEIGSEVEIWVDGGIRTHTVPKIAAAGAVGVIAGSIVYSAPDPVDALHWLRAIGSNGKQVLPQCCLTAQREIGSAAS